MQLEVKPKSRHRQHSTQQQCSKSR